MSGVPAQASSCNTLPGYCPFAQELVVKALCASLQQWVSAQQAAFSLKHARALCCTHGSMRTNDAEMVMLDVTSACCNSIVPEPCWLSTACCNTARLVGGSCAEQLGASNGLKHSWTIHVAAPASLSATCTSISWLPMEVTLPVDGVLSTKTGPTTSGVCTVTIVKSVPKLPDKSLVAAITCTSHRTLLHM